jgi:hypothetical protein
MHGGQGDLEAGRKFKMFTRRLVQASSTADAGQSRNLRNIIVQILVLDLSIALSEVYADYSVL